MRALPFVDLLESAVEQANDGIAVMRFTGNPLVPVRIIYANAAIERLSGFTRSELLEPSNPFLRVQPHHRPRYEEYFDRIRAGESVLFEIELTGRDRATWCEIRWSPIQFENDPVSHYVAVIRDISERRAAQRNVDLLQGIDRASYGLCIIEVDDGDVANRRVTYINDALCSMFKTTREDLMARGLPPSVFPQSAAIFEDDLRGIAAVGSIERDLLLRRGDESARWFHVAASAILSEDGVLERLTLTYRDIDEEKRGASGTRALDALLSATQTPAFLLEDLDGGREIRYANPALAAAVRLDPSVLAGNSIDTLLAVSNEAATLASLARHFKKRVPFTIEFTLGDATRGWNAVPLAADLGMAWLFIARAE